MLHVRQAVRLRFTHPPRTGSVRRECIHRTAHQVVQAPLAYIAPVCAAIFLQLLAAPNANAEPVSEDRDGLITLPRGRIERVLVGEFKARLADLNDEQVFSLLEKVLASRRISAPDLLSEAGAQAQISPVAQQRGSPPYVIAPSTADKAPRTWPFPQEQPASRTTVNQLDSTKEPVKPTAAAAAPSSSTPSPLTASKIGGSEQVQSGINPSLIQEGATTASAPAKPAVPDKAPAAAANITAAQETTDAAVLGEGEEDDTLKLFDFKRLIPATTDQKPSDGADGTSPLTPAVATQPTSWPSLGLELPRVQLPALPSVSLPELPRLPQPPALSLPSIDLPSMPAWPWQGQKQEQQQQTSPAAAAADSRSAPLAGVLGMELPQGLPSVKDVTNTLQQVVGDAQQATLLWYAATVDEEAASLLLRGGLGLGFASFLIWLYMGIGSEEEAPGQQGNQQAAARPGSEAGQGQTDDPSQKQEGVVGGSVLALGRLGQQQTAGREGAMKSGSAGASAATQVGGLAVGSSSAVSIGKPAPAGVSQAASSNQAVLQAQASAAAEEEGEGLLERLRGLLMLMLPGGGAPVAADTASGVDPAAGKRDGVGERTMDAEVLSAAADTAAVAALSGQPQDGSEEKEAGGRATTQRQPAMLTADKRMQKLLDNGPLVLGAVQVTSLAGPASSPLPWNLDQQLEPGSVYVGPGAAALMGMEVPSYMGSTSTEYRGAGQSPVDGLGEELWVIPGVRNAVPLPETYQEAGVDYGSGGVGGAAAPGILWERADDGPPVAAGAGPILWERQSGDDAQDAALIAGLSGGALQGQGLLWQQPDRATRADAASAAGGGMVWGRPDVAAATDAGPAAGNGVLWERPDVAKLNDSAGSGILWERSEGSEPVSAPDAQPGNGILWERQDDTAMDVPRLASTPVSTPPSQAPPQPLPVEPVSPEPSAATTAGAGNSSRREARARRRRLLLDNVDLSIEASGSPPQVAAPAINPPLVGVEAGATTRVAAGATTPPDPWVRGAVAAKQGALASADLEVARQVQGDVVRLAEGVDTSLSPWERSSPNRQQ